MANLIELIGQKEVALADMRADADAALSESNSQYRKLWSVLWGVKEGTIQIKDVTLIQDANGNCSWAHVPEPSVDDDLAPDASSALSAIPHDEPSAPTKNTD